MKKLLSAFAFILLATLCLVSCTLGDGDTDTEAAVTTEEVTETVPETEAETEPVVVLPEYINPLTGLGAEKDLSVMRPAAVMLNNIWQALPQEGISECDIVYECLVEGGITRLLGVTSDYSRLGKIGSVRSCREYYLDLARNHDAIYVHAGGSDQAYLEIKQRDIDNLDGVNMYVPGMFFRDEERLKTMGYEHTLMTDGEKIAAGVAFKKYRTELNSELSGKNAFSFTEYGEQRVLDGGAAPSVYLPYSKYQHAKFVYDEATGSYYRFHFEDVPHIDGTTGAQISFTNVFVLICKTTFTGDALKHIDVITESENGTGYYISGGRYEEITWSKPTADSVIKYYGVDGNELKVNRGKTFISIFPDYNTVSFPDITEEEIEADSGSTVTDAVTDDANTTNAAFAE